MQVTIDIADELIGRLQELAEERQQTIERTLAEEIEGELLDTEPRAKLEIRYDGPRGFPVIESRRPGTLKLGPEGVYEYIPFP